ncbi:MAG TPA: HTTM domain-containing protein [Polyangiaceae bacterium]|jgi:hypothetical protein
MAKRVLHRFIRVYFTADLRSLAAGRIVLALVLLLDLAKRWAQLDSWYTNDGLVPNHTLLWRPAFTPVFSLFYLASYTQEATFGFVICACAYSALLIGFRTRIAQLASLVCLLSLHGRLLIFDNGGDVVLGLLCIWTTFLPTGTYASVDAVLARRRAALELGEDALRAVEDSRGVAPTWVSLAVCALTLQLAAIYFFNAAHKTGATWREGSAVHYVLHLDRLSTGFAVWLRARMTPTISHVLTFGALGTEWLLPVLLLSPVALRACRNLAILLVISLHTGFALCLNLGVFVPAMIAFTPNFLSSEDWELLSRWRMRAGPVARWARRLCERSATMIERAAALLSPGASRRVSEPGPAARAFARQLPALRELTIAATLFVAGNQLLDENQAAHRVIDHHNSPPIAAAVTYLALFQGWSMFAPDAPTTDLNLVVDAITVDDRHVDPFNQVANPRYPAPGETIPSALGTGWLFYGYVNRIPGYPAYDQALQEWILRYPERTRRPSDRIRSFRVLTVEDDSPPLGARMPSNTRSRLLFQYP